MRSIIDYEQWNLVGVVDVKGFYPFLPTITIFFLTDRPTIGTGEGGDASPCEKEKQELQRSMRCINERWARRNNS
jgi:hypothetical protein